MPTPLVSVVTSVYNGGRFLRVSLESVLVQQGVDFEFVVIDDGSTDDTPQVLAELASQHPRLRVCRQENQGLTRALIRGCQEARGAYIARHDADDLSLPGRLAAQVNMLLAEPRLALLSCWSRTIGPTDELLWETTHPLDFAECTRRLIEAGVGPHHGSVLFRAADYRRVGGYRTAFRFTQDWDLWLRLTEIGLVGYVPAYLFAFRISGDSISVRRRGQQLRLLDLARAARAARSAGQAEQPFLDEAARVCAERAAPARDAEAANSYFIGKCLLDRRDPRAIAYLRRSVWQRPWHWRSWAALALATVRCRRPAALPELSPTPSAKGSVP